MRLFGRSKKYDNEKLDTGTLVRMCLQTQYCSKKMYTDILAAAKDDPNGDRHLANLDDAIANGVVRQEEFFSGGRSRRDC